MVTLFSRSFLLVAVATLVASLPQLQLVGCSVTAHGERGPITIFQPPSNYLHQRSLYGRILQLKHGKRAGTLLSTFESYSPIEPVAFPIFESQDKGITWHSIANVTDQKNHYGNRYQPFLYELPSRFGQWDKGTILLAGNSIPSDLSTTQLNLYVSTDQGKRWSFVSTFANGGEALPNNGLTPVWEPFLMLHHDELIVYYSDQRDPKYGQKLVHQTTRDGYSWSSTVNDVTSPDYGNRPGMPIVSMMGNGKYIMSGYQSRVVPIRSSCSPYVPPMSAYENLEAPEAQFAAYYKISKSPLAFGNETGRAIQPNNAAVPSSSPYNVWSPIGGKNGTLIANAGSSPDIFVNYAYGEGEWVAKTTAAPASYSRSLAVDAFDSSILYIVGGGPIDGNGTTNAVRFNSMKL